MIRIDPLPPRALSIPITGVIAGIVVEAGLREHSLHGCLVLRGLRRGTGLTVKNSVVFGGNGLPFLAIQAW